MNPSTNQPSYYATISADVRYCKQLEPNAKLLYGELNALANKEGYCWAWNQYFSELYEVDERTVRRWLKSLSDLKFIFIIHSTDENGQNQRKIYIKQPPVEIISTPDKNVRGGGQKCPGGEGKNVRPTIYNNTTENVVVVVGGEPPPENVGNVHNSKKQEKCKLTKDDVYRHSLVSKKDWVPEEIEDAWQAYLSAVETREITDELAYIDGIIRKKRIIKAQPKKDYKKCQNKFNNKNTSNEPQEPIKPKPLDYDMSVQLLARFA